MSDLKYGDKIRALVIGQGKKDFEEARHKEEPCNIRSQKSEIGREMWNHNCWLNFALS
jgi:hypothetical protein